MKHYNNRRRQFLEEWEQSDISNDYIFSKVMAQPQLCLQLIKSALPQLKIKRVYVRSQDGLSANVDAKDVRLDISTYGKGGEMFDIEMQTIRPKYLMQRILYYHSTMITERLYPRESYGEIPKTYVIFICLFDWYRLGNSFYEVNLVPNGVNELKLKDGFVSLILNPYGDITGCSEELQDFFDLVAGRPAGRTDFVREVKYAVKLAKRRNDWRDRYMLVKDWVQDRVDYAVEQNTITMQEKFAQQLIKKTMSTEHDYDSLRADLIDFFDADFADKMLAKYYQQA
ncbi:Rpn family recombination-promoting nuclease/putative transposase [Ligilactobacillus agilis]|uniref:Rpn family recombination-promoting nuclease/putative transposase n=1 Tax=Ligilactobacillus agilis TaxID=1601 RepID=UPI0022DFAFCB|nr:Rpn family recombination-promoting nuclease/putative transposase [Ligilactobacillus agilis]